MITVSKDVVDIIYNGLYGVGPRSISLLGMLHDISSCGGLENSLEYSEGGGQEFKLKVSKQIEIILELKAIL